LATWTVTAQSVEAVAFVSLRRRRREAAKEARVALALVVTVTAIC